MGTINVADIKRVVDKIKPYKLYGSREQIEAVREHIPGNVELIEIPEICLPDSESMILVDMRVLSYELRRPDTKIAERG